MHYKLSMVCTYMWENGTRAKCENALDMRKLGQRWMWENWGNIEKGRTSFLRIKRGGGCSSSSDWSRVNIHKPSHWSPHWEGGDSGHVVKFGKGDGGGGTATNQGQEFLDSLLLSSSNSPFYFYHGKLSFLTFGGTTIFSHSVFYRLKLSISIPILGLYLNKICWWFVSNR